MHRKLKLFEIKSYFADDRKKNVSPRRQTDFLTTETKERLEKMNKMCANDIEKLRKTLDVKNAELKALIMKSDKLYKSHQRKLYEAARYADQINSMNDNIKA